MIETTQPKTPEIHQRTALRPIVTSGSWGAAILAVIAVIYGYSTRGYFFDDDFHWLAQTLEFHAPNMFDLSRYAGFYRPVIEVYFLAGLTLFGCNAFPFHLASVAIHALTTCALYGFARTASGSTTFAWLSALFFAVQPGLVDAVTWIAAITDQLPALWYVLTLWLFLLFLKQRDRRLYVLALLTFVLCHLTHESSVTLLPMMMLTSVTFVGRGPIVARVRQVADNWQALALFALLWVAYLILAYIINIRSLLIRDSYYAFGFHAIPNIANYIIWLYVGRRDLVDYLVVSGALVALLAWGTDRVRFSVLWILVTLAPVSFFTWDPAPRYLYLPAAGFAMLVADFVLMVQGLAERRWSRQYARMLVTVLVCVLAGRSLVFAKKAADSWPVRTRDYERFVSHLRRSNPAAAPGSTVFIDRAALEGIPEVYRRPAAQVGLCLSDIRLEIR